MSEAKSENSVPGLALCLAVGTAAFILGELAFVKDTLHMSALLLAILLGMLIASLITLPQVAIPGIRIAQRPLLRWGVAGLGFRLSLPELVKIGAPALGVVLISTAAALWFGWWLAKRVGLEEKLGLLLGVGGAICGASAVVAADSVVQGEKRHSAYALGIITLLGTIGIVVYPILFHLFSMSEQVYAVWNGASLQEMAQVVAAGDIISQNVASDATVVKLARICLLAPVVFGLAWWLRSKHKQAGEAHVAPVPWFLIVFLIFVVINSLNVLPADAVKLIQRGVLWLLCVGMVGVGLQTGFRDIKQAGIRPLMVGAGQWLFLAVISYALTVLLLR